MQLVDEGQRPPLALGFLVALISSLLASVVVFLSGDSLSQANNTYWYMTRAAGTTSYLLLAASSILGVSSTCGFWDRLRARRTITQIHQFASVLLIPFLAIHLWALHMDQSVPFPYSSLFIPLRASYRPMGTATGIIALYAILVIVVSSIASRITGMKTWRRIHYISFPTFVLVTIHGLTVGTDSSHLAFFAMYAIAGIAFIILAFIRFFDDEDAVVGKGSTGT